MGDSFKMPEAQTWDDAKATKVRSLLQRPWPNAEQRQAFVDALKWYDTNKRKDQPGDAGEGPGEAEGDADADDLQQAPAPGTPIRVNPDYAQNHQAPAYVPGGEGDPDRDGPGAWLRGFGQGGTARLQDEAVAGMTPKYQEHGIPLPYVGFDDRPETLARAKAAKSIPREYAAGSAYADQRDNMRRDVATDKAAYSKAPFWADPQLGGELTGGAALALAAGGPNPAAPNASMADRVIQSAGQGAKWGGAVGMGGSESDSTPGVIADTAKGAATGAVLAPAVSEGARFVGGLASRAADATGLSSVPSWLGQKADTLRFGATGVYPQQADALLREKGPEYIRELGQHAEQLKSEQGLGWASPWNARDYNNAATRDVADTGSAIGGNLSTADAEGVRIPTDPIADQLDAQASTYGGKLGTDPGDAQATRLRSEAKRWRTPPPSHASVPPKELTPSDVAGMKREYESLGGYRGDKIATLPHGSTPEMYQDAANPVRDALYSGMDGSSVGPEFRDNMTRYGKSNTILNASNKRVMHDNANQIVSLPSAVLAAGGLEAGGGPGGLAAGAGMGLVKGYGKDIVATSARAAQKGLQGIGSTMSAVEPSFEASLMQSGASREGNDTVQHTVMDMLTGPSVAHAQQRPGADDPEYGDMLSNVDPDEADVKYYVLMQTDADFRNRQRARADQSREQQEQQQHE